MSDLSLSKAIENARIAVIGLGYVGLPLSIAFACKYNVLGFDIDEKRIAELNDGRDHTREVDLKTLQAMLSLKSEPTLPTDYDSTPNQYQLSSTSLSFSSDPDDLRSCNIYIVTVPTPVNQFKAPDLTALISASKLLGSVLKVGDLVIYESTVYPGCTEEECVPVLERVSGLVFNKDFYVGYSPERINPGDKANILTKIIKVTSGSTSKVADRVDTLYRSIIEAGTHKAPNIKVAEASKAIENAQRDLNISFVNELALIFDRIGIDTYEVLEAAGTKWNFLPYKPGLVGGHCIGVDPYYLAHKAQVHGYTPNVILSGRRVNDQMGAFVAGKVIKLMLQKNLPIKDSKALVMGITFKENCPDIRNTGVVNVCSELVQFGLDVTIYDPWADGREVQEEYGLEIINDIPQNTVYDAIVVAVAHNEFLNFNYNNVKRPNGVIFDIKGCLDKEMVDGRL